MFNEFYAYKLTDKTYFMADLRQLWARLMRRPCFLFDLADVVATCVVRERHTLGLQCVSLAQIRGSEGRCHDFDASFRPLCQHNQTRWLAVAQLFERGADMPPVELIQVGEVYFVRDGHHRVSVARARGHHDIEAVVTRWQVEGVPPWERRERLPRASSAARRLAVKWSARIGRTTAA
jgi:hypothetical protein